MEDDCEAYVDSEEDEVFFGCINEKELQYFEKKKIENANANSCDASVKMDHNYSIHVKEKIDKSILKTPRSIVKADKDGGFLKVLSEIALVKAEVENSEKSFKNKYEDDNKENKVSCIPEIIITKATPKNKMVSRCQNIDSQVKFRKVRFIYNSPTLENMEKKSLNKSDFLKKKKNGYNKKAKNTNNAFIEKDFVSFANNSNDSNSASINLLQSKENEPILQCNNKILKTNYNDSLKKKRQANNLFKNSFITSGKNYGNIDRSLQITINKEKKSNTVSDNCISTNDELHNLEKGNIFSSEKFENKNQIAYTTNSDLNNLRTTSTKFKNNEDSTSKVVDEFANLKKFRENATLSKQLRFSQEVRKVVEVINKSSEDTFDFIIPEIELNNTEDSFLSFKPISFLDENNDFYKSDLDISQSKSKLISPYRKNNIKMVKKQFNTVEKSNFKKTSDLSGNKIEILSYSERKMQPMSQYKINKCVKKLPIIKKDFESKIKMKGNLNFQKPTNTDFISKIPIYEGKMTKVSNSGKKQCVITQTSLKFPSEKIYKNQKFKHVTSPIKAYIHGKPSTKPTDTNVKLEANENGVTKVFKTTKLVV